MIDPREIGITELIARLKERKEELGLVSFLETPSGEVDPEKLPAVALHEGVDAIEKYSNRTASGYPAKRSLVVVFECLVDVRNVGIRSFCKDVRRALFLDRTTNQINIFLAPEVYIKEVEMEGPIGYGLPNLNGMKLTLNLYYTDEGIVI